MMKLLMLLCTSMFLGDESSGRFLFSRPKHPCSVVLDEMRFGGYLTRDCTYMDPFVYWRIEHLMSWQGARSACQQVAKSDMFQIAGGDLVSIHSFNEKQTVNAMAQNNYVDQNDQNTEWRGLNQGIWIGLHHDKTLGNKKWGWSDESVVDYEDWLSGQPEKEECVQTVSLTPPGLLGGAVAFGWNDVSCRRALKAICKVPRVAVFP